jgi:ribose 5-phosphate isomerase B
MTKYTIAIDCDDAAIDMKNVIYEYLKEKKVSITDLEYSANNDSAYYPEIGYNLAKKIQQGIFNARAHELGILR